MARAPSRIVAPSAAALIDSLRGVGYSLQTAIADLIDNSIAAHATRVELTFEWARGRPWIAILDDGRGMSEQELVEAMRFGGGGPSLEREADDLGRFGLGLKTASLSQCRRLTVASRQDGETHVFRWDLDHVRDPAVGWELLEGPAPGSEALIAPLDDRPQGTLVLWELLDFGRSDEVITGPEFLEEIESTETHLAMVFHRFLGGDARRLAITINGGRRVSAWDPFLESHPSTRRRPEQTLGAGTARVRVRGFILPHRDRFASEEDYLNAGGPLGWNAQQGFYIYRNKRLLAAGGWLGLGGSRAWTREESSRLARIRVDIPNTADRDWSIDVKKSVARPPVSMRIRLSQIAADVRSAARDVFVYRGNFGPRPKREEVARIWEPGTSAVARYRIMRNHPAVAAAVPSDQTAARAFEAMLVLIERTVPVERIWLDVTEDASRLSPQTSAPDDELTASAVALVRALIKRGKRREEAIDRVCTLDPYDTIPGFAESLGRSL